MKNAPTQFPARTIAKFLKKSLTLLRFSRVDKTIKQFPVKRSPPLSTTNIRPIGNTAPVTNFATPLSAIACAAVDDCICTGYETDD